MLAVEQKSFQLVVAATRQLGIGKGGTMPWKLPADMAYFKELTSSTHDPAKMNAVVTSPDGRPAALAMRVLMAPQRCFALAITMSITQLNAVTFNGKLQSRAAFTLWRQ